LARVVESRLLGLLRVEKKRLREELRKMWPFLPQTEVDLKRLESPIALLEKRIDVAARAGALRKSKNSNRHPLSIFEADKIEAVCEAALDVAYRSAPTPEDFKSVEESFLTALKVLEDSHQKPSEEAIKELEKHISDVKSVVVAPQPADMQKIDEVLQGLRRDVAGTQDWSRDEYVRKAEVGRKAELVIRFIRLVEASPNKDVRDACLRSRDSFLKTILPGADASIARAYDVVQQAAQNVTREDLQNAIKNKNVWIEMDPPTPLPYQLVTFRVRLRRSGLDTAVARKEVPCSWEGSAAGLKGAEGWAVSTFFAPPPGWWRRRIATLWQRLFKKNSTYDALAALTVKAIFKDIEAAQMITVNLDPIKSYDLSRLWLAVGTQAVTVLIVSVGLLGGGQEKIQALDWPSAIVALLAIGFGADTLKKVLTRE
jgi:chorismate mutase